MRRITEFIKRHPPAKRWTLWLFRVFSPIGNSLRPSTVGSYGRFVRDWRQFKSAGGIARMADFYPCLFDRTSRSGIDSHYFYQSLWAFKKILAAGTRAHVDVASQVSFVGLLSAITRVIFLEIRPLVIRIHNFHGLAGSITSLPFRDASVDSLSSLHVIEHIGLGRYGDHIDPLGPEKACREIARVLKPGGNAYISVPIGRPRVSFNGLRVFSACEAVRLFADLDLREMGMIDVPGNFIPIVEPEHADIRESEGGSDFGLGLFWFQKPSHSG